MDVKIKGFVFRLYCYFEKLYFVFSMYVYLHFREFMGITDL